MQGTLLLEMTEMDFASYVKQLSFRYITPDARSRVLLKLNRTLRPLNIGLELTNTRLPEHRKAMQTKLYEILKMPRMSTFAIGAIINKGVSVMSPASCFVNVGVWHGFTLLAGLAGNAEKTCIGVDNFSEFGGPREWFLREFDRRRGPNHFFYDMDYKAYFSSKHVGPIGMYLYDGEHGYENQLEGLRVAEPFFSDGCIVLVDDTNWEEPRRATLDFIAGSRSRYEILLDQRTAQNRHPTLWNGLFVFRKTA